MDNQNVAAVMLSNAVMREKLASAIDLLRSASKALESDDYHGSLASAMQTFVKRYDDERAVIERVTK